MMLECFLQLLLILLSLHFFVIMGAIVDGVPGGLILDITDLTAIADPTILYRKIL